MIRKIVSSKSFDKKLEDFLFCHPQLKKKLQKVVTQLRRNVFYSSLETHKLSGELKEFYACSVDYEYRLVFVFDSNSIYLLNIGSHHEVY